MMGRSGEVLVLLFLFLVLVVVVGVYTVCDEGGS